MTEGLPTFLYHPDPIATGSIVAASIRCACCHRLRAFCYRGTVYAAEDLDNRLCPWCIADGSAARVFDAEFTEPSWTATDGVSVEATEIVVHRTPGFVGWQQERWLHHCNDAAEFHGLMGASDLAS